MISVKVSIPESQVETLTLFAERAADSLMQTAQSVFDDLRGPFLDDLQRYPGETKRPIKWTSDAQRRWWFWHLDQIGAELGKTYQRTGALAKSWDVIGEAGSGRFIMVVSTSSETARFVVGGLSEVLGPKTNYKQGFHTNTGWQDAPETVRLYFDRYVEELARALKERTS